MFQVLRQRNYALLWFGGFISNLGDFVLFVGLPYEVYRLTNSTLAIAGMVLAHLVPHILLGSIAGVYVDRWDRRRLMIVVNLLQAVSILPLLLVPELGLWVVYAVLVVESSISQLFGPAETAIMPLLLAGGKDELLTANALSGVGHHLSRLIGPAIGGIVVAIGGLSAVTVVDSVSFVASAGMLALIRMTPTSHRATESIEHAAVSAWRRLAHEWREGLRAVLHQPILRALLIFASITAVGEGLTSALFVVWVVGPLHSDSTGWGLVLDPGDRRPRRGAGHRSAGHAAASAAAADRRGARLRGDRPRAVHLPGALPTHRAGAGDARDRGRSGCGDGGGDHDPSAVPDGG